MTPENEVAIAKIVAAANMMFVIESSKNGDIVNKTLMNVMDKQPGQFVHTSCSYFS